MLGACAIAHEYDENQFKFMKFIADHSKNYQTLEEYYHRFENWMENETFINQVNSPDSAWTHTAGHNQFSDLTEQEFSKLMTLQTPPHVLGELYEKEEGEVNAKSIDWRAQNCVNAVVNQGNCGSCWAFTSIVALEGSYCALTGTLLKLSE